MPINTYNTHLENKQSSRWAHKSRGSRKLTALMGRSGCVYLTVLHTHGWIYTPCSHHYACVCTHACLSSEVQWSECRFLENCHSLLSELRLSLTNAEFVVVLCVWHMHEYSYCDNYFFHSYSQLECVVCHMSEVLPCLAVGRHLMCRENVCG